jgi:signal transduction histidine kinase
VRTIPNLVAQRRAQLVAAIEERVKRSGLLGATPSHEAPLAVADLLELVTGDARIRRGFRTNGTRLASAVSKGSELAGVLGELASIRRAVEAACFDLDPASRPTRAEWDRFMFRIDAAMRAVGERFESEVAATRELDARFAATLDELVRRIEDGDAATEPSVVLLGSELMEVMRQLSGCDAVHLRVVERKTGSPVFDSCAGRGANRLLSEPEARSQWGGTAEGPSEGVVLRQGVEPVTSSTGAAGTERVLRFFLGPRARHRGTLTFALHRGRREEPARVERARDLGERLLARLERAIDVQDLRRRVEEFARERERRIRFVASLVHDLRGPLATAKLGSQLLQRTASASGVNPEVVLRVLRNLDRMDGMIRDLLDVSRVEAGQRLALEVGPCDLAELADDIVRDVSLSHGARFRFERTGPVVGFWSAVQLRRAVWNLCVNAARYGAAKAEIRVWIESDDNVARLCVHNEGEAIAKAEQTKLFEAFRRGSGPSAFDGSWGLGLSVVRLCAEAHGGHASVQSHPGDGTTFTLSLPLDARRFVCKDSATDEVPDADEPG